MRNPTLKKIIDTLKDKVKDGDAERKIYNYLDFIDNSGVIPPFATEKVRQTAGDSVKTKKHKKNGVGLSKEGLPADTFRDRNDSSRREIIEKKMGELRVNFEEFTKKVRKQQEENSRLKKVVEHFVKERSSVGEKSDAKGVRSGYKPKLLLADDFDHI